MKPTARQTVWRVARLVLLVGGPCALAALPAPLLPWAGGAWSATAASVAVAALALTALIAWVVILVPRQKQDTRWARQHPLIWWGLLALGSALITASLIGASVHAQFRIIDDHARAVAPWPRGHASLREFLAAAAASSEIGRPGLDSRRYRPVDATMILIQRVIWGDHASGYWATRIAMFGIAVCMGWWALWVWLGGPAAGLILAWVLTFPFWSDVWCRLGPAEGTGTLGTAMLAAGAAALLVSGHRRWRDGGWAAVVWWSMVGVGGVIAVGSKENFLILLPVTWALMGWVWWHGRLGKAGWIGGGVVTLWGLWVGGIVAAATIHAGKDFYANPVSAGSRFAQLAQWVRTPGGEFWTIAAGAGAVLIIAAAMTYALSPPSPARRRLARTLPPLSALALVMVLTALSQVVLYNGQFTPPRYLFPFQIAALLACISIAILVLRWLGQCAGSRAANAALIIVLVAIGWIVLAHAYDALHRETHNNVIESRQFTAAMDQIGTYARREPHRPLVFVAHRPMDAEPVASVLKFLRVRAVTNPAFLYNRGYDLARITDPLNHTVGQAMSDLSLQGGQGFQPWSSLPKDQVPFGLFFSGPPKWRGPMDALYVESSAGAVGE